jgi:hypothetical protein
VAVSYGTRIPLVMESPFLRAELTGESGHQGAELRCRNRLGAVATHIRNRLINLCVALLPVWPGAAPMKPNQTAGPPQP